jgi:hypothetical protein
MAFQLGGGATRMHFQTRYDHEIERAPFLGFRFPIFDLRVLLVSAVS